jgi:catechol 2,3-dioxygenase-like lactoylglutathione lyase family enzyme
MEPSVELVAFVPSTDLERSRTFYESVLGLRVDEMSAFACVARSGSTTLRITLVGALTPQPFTVLGWSVADIRGELALLRQHDVDALRFEGIGQDSDDIWTAPGGAQVAWFHDPDGNVLSFTQL